jgi:DNA polymerase-1
MNSPSGVVTTGTYIFVRTLFKILHTPGLNYLAIALDSSRKNLERTKVFPAYKEHRNELPDDFIESIKLTFQVLESLQLPTFKVDGHEADDIIGSLTKYASEEVPAVIVSTDKDFLQLASPNVSVYNPVKDEWYDADSVETLFELGSIKQVIDYKMLVGDTSDNYKGVKGIGPKKAVELLKQVDRAEDIVSISGSLNEKLQKAIAETDFTVLRKLATIRTDLDIVSDLEALNIKKWSIPDPAKAIFKELGFKRWSE